MQAHVRADPRSLLRRAPRGAGLYAPAELSSQDFWPRILIGMRTLWRDGGSVLAWVMVVSANAETDVLIIGAGPSGLVLALWLTHLGIRVRIIDKTAEPGTTSRALAVQARTLELYDQLGLADAVVKRSRAALAGQSVGDRQAARAFGIREYGRRDQPLSLSGHLSPG